MAATDVDALSELSLEDSAVELESMVVTVRKAMGIAKDCLSTLHDRLGSTDAEDGSPWEAEGSAVIVSLEDLRSAIQQGQRAVQLMNAMGERDLERADYQEQVLSLRKKDLGETRVALAQAEKHRGTIEGELKKQGAVLDSILGIENSSADSRKASNSSIGSSFSAVTGKPGDSGLRSVARQAAAVENSTRQTERGIEQLSQELVSLSDDLIAIRQEKEELRQKLKSAEQF